MRQLGWKALSRVFGDQYWIRLQDPLHLDNGSEPEPDIAVVPGHERDYIGTGHPKSAVLVVEVADTSLGYDLGPKASLYARAGIQDYWVIDLTRRTVIVHRDPIEDSTRRHGWRYGDLNTIAVDTSIKPFVLPQESVAVSDLIP